MPPTNTRIFPEARQVLDHLIAGLDELAPGLVTGAHIIGSIALGDGRPGQSDIDLVLVRAEGASNDETMTALEPVLADLPRTRPQPVIDGLVLSEADLAAGPDEIEGERPIIFDNEVRLGSDGSGRNPVTWHTLRQCGIAYRGGPIDRNRLWHDPARLDAWTRENLEAYWRPCLGRAERLAAHPDLPALIDEATEWGVLGVTRLHYTLATGQVASKLGAGAYALETLPSRGHPIVEEVLRIRERRDEPSRFPDLLSRVGERRDYKAMVIEAADRPRR